MTPDDEGISTMTRLHCPCEHEMTPKEFGRLEAERVTCISEGTVRQTLDLRRENVPVTVLPMAPVGKGD